jgi:RHS repeat-associated protein
VEKSNASGGTLYWRATSGAALAETDLNGNITSEYVFFAGQRIARRDSSNNVYYYYTDQVGSTTAITTASGTPCYGATFTPYGEEHNTLNTCAQNYKFTGYERDSETGLDYAFARYYDSRLGRFLSADPLASNPTSPQSLNRYAYTMNNPNNLVDPLGLRWEVACVEAGGVKACTYDWYDDPVTVGYSNVLYQNDGGGGGGKSSAPINLTQLDSAQCAAAKTVLAREAQYGTPKAARMSGNTFGDNTLSPFNSTYVPNLQSPVGQIDLDWFTDVSGYGGGQYTNAIVYTGAKSLWTLARLSGGLAVGHYLPFADPGERNAVWQATINTSYADIFTPAYMQQACGGH